MGLSLLAALVTVSIVEWRRSRLQAPAPHRTLADARPPLVHEAPPDPDAAMRVYRDSIVPMLDEFDERNAAAVDRAIRTLHERVAIHRAGVRPFARDVRSWGTRFGVMRRYPGDVWHRLRHQPQARTQVATYVNEKFRRDVLSEDQLQQDVRYVLTQFEEDLAANRNRLYARMSLPLASIRCRQPIVGAEFDQFRNETQRRGLEMSRQLAPDTVVAGLAEFSVSWVATDVTQALASRLVGQILARVGTAMAVDGIAAGGATVGGGATGGSAGSFAGPAGTIVGIGIGVAVGAAVDWWLSDRFEARVVEQSNEFLSTLELRLSNGSAKSPGLRQSLTETVRVTNAAQRQAVRNAMQEIQPQ